jgi:predicted PurR-regulated permease PerM
MDDIYFKKITTAIIFLALLVLSFFLIKPILLSMIGRIIFAFIFYPIFNKLVRLTKSRGFSAAVICIFLLLLIVTLLWFLTPSLIDESIKIYRASQQMDLVAILKGILPSLFASAESSEQMGSILQGFITKATNYLMNLLSNLILELPTILMDIFVMFFTFYYALRDKDKILKYIQDLLPFSDEVVKKLFSSTKEITSSVLFGQVVLGAIQGVILSIGLFIFAVPNAWVLALASIATGILPILGPALIGVPVAIFLIIGGNTFSAIGILIFTVLATFSDNLLRPALVAKRAKLHTAVALIGTIGGMLLFGVVGLVIGPLILAYMITLIGIYKNKPLSGILVKKE